MEHKDSFFPNVPLGYFSTFTILLFGMASFSLFQGVLMQYVINALHFKENTAASLATTFSALMFAIPLITNYIAQRFIGYATLIVASLLLAVIGLYTLYFGTEAHFYIGVALFVSGNSAAIAAIYLLLGCLFSQDDRGLTSGYTFAYGGMNIGAFAALGITPSLLRHWGYQNIFLFSAICVLIALMIYAINYKSFYQAQQALCMTQHSTKRQLFGIACLVILAAPVLWCLDHPNGSWIALITLLLIGIIIAVRRIKKMDKDGQKKMLGFCIALLFATIFWTLYAMEPSVLNQFSSNHIDRHILGASISIYDIYLLNPLFIIVFALLLTLLWRKLDKADNGPSLAYKFSSGIAVMGVAFIILAASTFFKTHAGLSSIGWIITSYMLLSIAELLISPIGLAGIRQIIPPKEQGMMMGIWLLGIGFGVQLSGFVSTNLINSQQHVGTLFAAQSFTSHFTEYGLASLIIALVLALLGQRLTGLMKG